MQSLRRFRQNQWGVYSENELDKVLPFFAKPKVFLLQFSGKSSFITAINVLFKLQNQLDPKRLPSQRMLVVVLS